TRPSECVRGDRAILQEHEVRIDGDVAALPLAALDGGGDLTAGQLDERGGVDGDVTAIRLLGSHGYFTVLTDELVAGREPHTPGLAVTFGRSCAAAVVFGVVG